MHPIEGDEIRLLRRLKLKYPDSPFVFTSERGAPLTTSAVRKIVARAGESAKIGFPVHPHMLRHSCGHYLANRGVDTRSIQAYLGHRSIEHTVRYTELLPDRFKGFWKHWATPGVEYKKTFLLSNGSHGSTGVRGKLSFLIIVIDPICNIAAKTKGLNSEIFLGNTRAKKQMWQAALMGLE